jgi:DNA-binding CsgD family transcriptional regulator
VQLASLGLPAGPEAVYRVALVRATWTVEDLSSTAGSVTGLSEGEVAAALDALRDLGLVQPSTQEADLRVVAPAVALQTRLEDLRQSVQDAQARVAQTTHALDALQDSYTSARDVQLEQSVERLTGLDAIRSRLEQLARDAQREVLSFMPGGAHSAAVMEASRPLDQAALESGVNMRNVYLHSALNDQATAQYLRWLRELGAETRTVAVLPMRMLVIDREVAVIPSDAEDPRAGALVLRSPGMMTALLALFESVWAASRPISAPRPAAAVELSDTEIQVLRLLAAGATDEGAARQLGVSVRTVRRLTSALLVRFSARSRFELGLKLRLQDFDAGPSA